MFVAAVGSREIRESEAETIVSIGKAIVANGHILKSGNAPGSDQKYAIGGNSVNPQKVYLYLPWKAFEKQYIVKGNIVTYNIEQDDINLAKEACPYWSNLTIGQKKLMARNSKIISQSHVVIARMNHGKANGGGTGHACRIADILKIKVIDISIENGPEEAFEYLKE